MPFSTTTETELSTHQRTVRASFDQRLVTIGAAHHGHLHLLKYSAHFAWYLGLGLLGGWFISKFRIRFKLFMVRSFVDTRRTPTRVGALAKALVPRHGTFRRAGNRFSSGDRPFSSFTGEELFEDHTITISFLRRGGIVREAVGGRGKHLIGNLGLSDITKVVDPAVSDT